MIYSSKENPNSRYTVKEREGPSLPVRVLFEKNLLVDDILDFGCGLGKDVEFLKSNRLNVQGYDPYYFPKYPQKKFGTIICFYVLNILLLDEQSHVLMAISELLKVGGKAYFAVRRDIKRNGFLFNPKHQVKTYQCNVTLPFKSIFKNENTEIYEYQHYNFLNAGKEKTSPFFKESEIRDLITESATAFAIYDKFPVSKGHALIIPKKLISNFFDLSNHIQTGCLLVLNRTKDILEKKFSAAGFNVGINVGEDAGQTVFHSHIHIIPRYKGDVKNPRGGIRKIINVRDDY
jgi:diadenosine tetraphosphate (Ap4A) HIT family hydrolase